MTKLSIGSLLTNIKNIFQFIPYTLIINFSYEPYTHRGKITNCKEIKALS